VSAGSGLSFRSLTLTRQRIEWGFTEWAVRCNMLLMQSIRYVYWQDGDAWLGHLEEYPDYLTQGKSLSNLEEHLRDLHKDLSGGVIPSVRKLAELAVS
jgi:hypothetical protein